MKIDLSNNGINGIYMDSNYSHARNIQNIPPIYYEISSSPSPAHNDIPSLYIPDDQFISQKYV